MIEIDLSIIVAMTDENRVIGNNGKLPWRLPSDLARFKENTQQTGVMIMGHNTYASILERNNKPLQGRKHIVLTRNKFLSSQYASVTFARSVEKALMEVTLSGGRAFVIGGGEIYRIFLQLPEVKRLYITTVYAPELSGDAYFPDIDMRYWKLIFGSTICQWDTKDEYETSHEMYLHLAQ